MAGLSRLPIEIIDLVLDHLEKPRHHLAVLCLVNKTHNNCFTTLLYQDVALQAAKHSCQLLTQFHNNPDQAAGVKKLTFAREPPVIGLKVSSCVAELIKVLPNVKTLTIDRWRSREGTWDSIQPLTLRSNPSRPLDRLEEIDITGLGRDEPIWPNAIMSLPSLKFLTFHMCRLGWDDEEPTPLADCSALPALQCLSLSNFDMSPQGFKALVGARACDTIRIEEVYRNKYSMPEEFIGSPKKLFKDVRTSTEGHLTGVKHFVHTDSKDWGCHRLTFAEFGSLTYLEVGAHNLLGALEEIDKDNYMGRRTFLRGLFPPSLQILCLDIPSRNNNWENLRGFLTVLARDKVAIALNLNTVVYRAISAFDVLDGVPNHITEGCKAAGIELTAAKSAKVYLDGKGKIVEIEDHMDAGE